MQTLVIPQSGNISGTSGTSGPSGNCQCGLRAPLTNPNPESTQCDAERPSPDNATKPNDVPGLFTALRTLFDQARIVVPSAQGQPYAGMENRPSGIMQPNQFTYGNITDGSRPAGGNTATNTTPKRWQMYRQPAARVGPPRNIIRRFIRQPQPNPRRPVMHQNPRHFNCATGLSQAAPLSVAGSINASGGDTSLLYLNLTSTGIPSANNYRYAGRVGQ
jgi:hypothetical protein